MGLKGYLLLCCSFLLVACGGKTYAPVSDRSAPVSAQPKPNHYQVRKGDTLYSIAFRYGLDYRELAKRNSISGNYNIYPGQKLSLKPSPKSTVSASIVRDASIVAPKPEIVSSRQKTTTKPQNTSPQVASKPTATPKASAKQAQTVAKVEQQKAAVKPAPKAQAKPSTVASGPIKWGWPASGKIVSTFKTKGTVNKGINIASAYGSKVKAAAKGRVVYAGSGLLGYGNLVIVDHNQQFLSAYAHNSRVLVKENDMVDKGQKIAEMGNSGTDRVMLHFEIRRDGKPVNPLRYLPKQ
ncbi:peptidoglycan DD-metalloendopeptidase family protein [Neptuniibacter sp. QD48_11]|uniref:peptidoglycan DD-metalloendopeptidase family protein n=1 Tax=Neptuniibacter sp. QD48_11 TaxID=3398211 RepID=UPI0039F522D9